MHVGHDFVTQFEGPQQQHQNWTVSEFSNFSSRARHVTNSPQILPKILTEPLIHEDEPCTGRWWIFSVTNPGLTDIGRFLLHIVKAAGKLGLFANEFEKRILKYELWVLLPTSNVLTTHYNSPPSLRPSF
jgi:hypothetical protein